jgi:hypothetical protein
MKDLFVGGLVACDEGWMSSWLAPVGGLRSASRYVMRKVKAKERELPPGKRT